ncbi:MAG: hypothetical protein IJB82_04565, partial [Bacilli bacterium]|nr:hypothetical protein [Bacilli bacterium]
TEGYYYLNSTCEGGNLTWDIYNRTLKLKGDGTLNYSSCKLDFESIDLKIYISGVESNNLPTTEGYSVSSNCGDATVTYAYPSLSITATENPEVCEIYFDINLKGKILADNNEQSDAGISFANTSASDGTNGLYYTSDTTKTENGEVVYYYRGAVTNNYLVFGGYCWRIVRTVEDGSVRLRYGGAPTQSGETYTCPQTGTKVNIASSQAYNTSYNNKSYVNYKTSSIRTVVENWYRDNIWKNGTNTKITNLIADTAYCNDMSEPTTTNLFGAFDRLYTNKSPQYKCASSTYGYTVAKGDLTYPIGLLTVDEAAYAGGVYTQTNTSYYLYTGETYWTMSPRAFDSNYANVFDVLSHTGAWDYYRVIRGYATVPALSLKAEATIKRGTGVYNDPYIILTN